ncbi:MAG TPA: putative lipid II flippase FtsW [Acidimicrobiales bacterium]|nr:putative lipid II flippase FtsW [Acidimicrobiales bacterium]
MKTQAPAKRRRRLPPRTGAYVGLIAVVGMLNLLGLVMVLSSSSVQAQRYHGSPWFFFNRQVLWVAIATTGLVVMSRIDYRRLRVLGAPIIAISSVLMLIVLIPGVGITVSGSARWLGFGPFRMQPSELAKLGLLIFAADLLARRGEKMYDKRQTLYPVMGAFLLVATLLMAQPDLGTTLVTGGIVIGVLFLAGLPLPSMVSLGLGAAITTFLLARFEPYRWQRMTSFLDPFADASNTGYQAAQGRVALAAGGLLGVGLGSSRAKWGFLPAAHTDFIFAIIGEELGLVGTLSVLAMFATFAALGVRSTMRAPDRFGMLLAGGVTAWIVGQATINVGAVVGLLPITGVPLPFVSAGGSSLVPLMAGVGVLLNITRQSGSATRPPTGSTKVGADAPRVKVKVTAKAKTKAAAAEATGGA